MGAEASQGRVHLLHVGLVRQRIIGIIGHTSPSVPPSP